MLDATPFLRTYADRRLAVLAHQDPVRTQRDQLMRLLRRAERTRFGRAHGFAGIARVDEYQRRVAPQPWETFWRTWWQPCFPRLHDVTWPGTIPYFANTSGTAGAATKRIPVSGDMVRANRRAALDVLVFHMAARADSRVLAGRNLILGGSTTLERIAPGIRGGDLSGIAAAEIPFWARGRVFPPPALALMEDWERKIELIAAGARTARITSFSGTPSWMLIFLDRLAAGQASRRLADIWPALELVVHGGVGFAPYRPCFEAWLAGSAALTREVYPASEGFIAVADRGEGRGMRMLLDNGIFYEFLRPDALGDANADRRWIADADTDVEYALLLSTNAGLWAYVLGDTVMLVDRNPPRLLVTGRTTWSLSVAGEHLIGHELDVAVAEAAGILGRTASDYAAAAIEPDAGDPRGGHVFIVELNGPTDPEAFAGALDSVLARLNADYAAHRAGGFGLRPPRIVLVRPGTFAAWMRERGRLGGQNKVPRVIADLTLRDHLLRAAAS
jgi:hypothetical protein